MLRSCTLSFFLEFVFVALFRTENFGKETLHIALLEMPANRLVGGGLVLDISRLD